jgi:predicted transcriptional regulator
MLKQMTAKLTAAYLRGNPLSAAELPDLIKQIYSRLAKIDEPISEPTTQTPAVSIRASVKPDRIICLECGKPQKMLRRHLATAHGLQPDDYRAKWNLPREYPMVAAEYAAKRSDLAKAAGLGHSRGRKAALAAQDEGAPGFSYPASRWAKPSAE